MRRCRPLLGTYVEIDIRHSDVLLAQTAMQQAYAAVERVQRLMSVHDADSDVSRLNRRAHLEPVAIDEWTVDVLTAGMAFHAATDGLFDCSVGRTLSGWGLLPDNLFEPSSVRASMHHLRLLDDNCVAAALPLDLDLGGIAKGYAVDKATEALQAVGVESAIVNAGGDLRVIGGIEVPIHVRDPRQPNRLHHAGSLMDGAVATSAPYFSAEGARMPEVSALVDPREHRAVVTCSSYSVIAPDCMTADALTKVVAVSGNTEHPCFARFGAQAFVLRAS